MSLADEVAEVLRDHPEIIASALESRLEVFYSRRYMALLSRTTSYLMKLKKL